MLLPKKKLSKQKIFLDRKVFVNHNFRVWVILQLNKKLYQSKLQLLKT